MINLGVLFYTELYFSPQTKHITKTGFYYPKIISRPIFQSCQHKCWCMLQFVADHRNALLSGLQRRGCQTYSCLSSSWILMETRGRENVLKCLPERFSVDVKILLIVLTLSQLSYLYLFMFLQEEPSQTWRSSTTHLRVIPKVKTKTSFQPDSPHQWNREPGPCRLVLKGLSPFLMGG